MLSTGFAEVNSVIAPVLWNSEMSLLANDGQTLDISDDGMAIAGWYSAFDPELFRFIDHFTVWVDSDGIVDTATQSAADYTAIDVGDVLPWHVVSTGTGIIAFAETAAETTVVVDVSTGVQTPLNAFLQSQGGGDIGDYPTSVVDVVYRHDEL